MTYDELKSPARREEDAKMEEQNMNSAMAAQPEKSISDQLECGKCKQRKVSYSQAQTRSADEPMTTFCECTVCGNRWKVSLSILERFTTNATDEDLSTLDWVFAVEQSKLFPARCANIQSGLSNQTV